MSFFGKFMFYPNLISLAASGQWYRVGLGRDDNHWHKPESGETVPATYCCKQQHSNGNAI